MLKVERVEHSQGYTLKILLSDGREGIFDVSPYLDKGVFTELQDINYLKQVRVDAFGGIYWPHEQDLSSDTIAAKLIAH